MPAGIQHYTAHVTWGWDQLSLAYLSVLLRKNLLTIYHVLYV